MENTPTSSEKMVNITRKFEAPRALVFKAWSEAEHLMRWFAPAGCELEIISLDFRPGGSLHCCIRNPAVRDCCTMCTYSEIEPVEKIAFSMGLADGNGNPKDPQSVGMDPAWPQVTTVVVTFEEKEGITTMHLSQTVSETLAMKTGAYPSWLSMFDRLENVLSAVAA